MKRLLNKFVLWLKTYKCTCGTKLYYKNTKEANHYYLNDYSGMVLEHDIVCKNCGRVVGHWAYGYEEPPTDRFEEFHMRWDDMKIKVKRLFKNEEF